MTDRLPGIMADTCIRVFGRGEAFDSHGFIEFFVENPVYQFGNSQPCFNKTEIFKSIEQFFSSVEALYHDIHNIWEDGDTVFIEMDVIYWRHDGSSIRLPCSDIFRFNGDKIAELRIFMDANPIFDPSLPVGKRASVFTKSGGKQAENMELMRRYFSEHTEGVYRATHGYPPKWSVAGPRWKIHNK